MYPFLQLGWLQLYTMWIWIILCIIFFIVTLRRLSKKRGVNVDRFMRIFPRLLVVPYVLWSYSYYLIEQFVIFPTSRRQLLAYVSPANFEFHLIGLIVGILIVIFPWLQTMASAETRVRRVDVLYEACMLTLVPLGCFLLLGEQFIGKSTTSRLYVTAIQDQSIVAAHGHVIPLGILVAIIWLLSYVIFRWISRKPFYRPGLGYLGFGVFALLMALLVMYQIYPRHLVLGLGLGNLSLDIKNYALIILGGWSLRTYFRWSDTQEWS